MNQMGNQRRGKCVLASAMQAILRADLEVSVKLISLKLKKLVTNG
jgi:hypothetical protein